MQNYTQIGQFKKPFGVRGVLRVAIGEAYWNSFADAEVIFVQERGLPVPYFVEKVEDSKGGLVKLEEIDSPEVARKLSNQAIYLKADKVNNADVVLDEHLIGFQLADQELGVIGEIMAIEEYPQQLMAIVAYEEKEILIPLTESLIVAISPEQKEIMMDLPDGLLEL